MQAWRLGYGQECWIIRLDGRRLSLCFLYILARARIVLLQNCAIILATLSMIDQ